MGELIADILKIAADNISTINLALTALFAVVVAWHVISGVARGAGRSIIRIIFSLVALLAAVVFTPIIYSSVAAELVEKFIGGTAIGGNEYIMSLLPFAGLFVNLILFYVVYYVLRIALYILGSLFVPIFKRGKAASRSMGAVIGLVQGVVVVFAICALPAAISQGYSNAYEKSGISGLTDEEKIALAENEEAFGDAFYLSFLTNVTKEVSTGENLASLDKIEKVYVDSLPGMLFSSVFSSIHTMMINSIAGVKVGETTYVPTDVSSTIGNSVGLVLKSSMDYAAAREEGASVEVKAAFWLNMSENVTALLEDKFVVAALDAVSDQMDLSGIITDEENPFHAVLNVVEEEYKGKLGQQISKEYAALINVLIALNNDGRLHPLVYDKLSNEMKAVSSMIHDPNATNTTVDMIPDPHSQSGQSLLNYIDNSRIAKVLIGEVLRPMLQNISDEQNLDINVNSIDFEKLNYTSFFETMRLTLRLFETNDGGNMGYIDEVLLEELLASLEGQASHTAGGNVIYDNTTGLITDPSGVITVFDSVIRKTIMESAKNQDGEQYLSDEFMALHPSLGVVNDRLAVVKFISFVKVGEEKDGYEGVFTDIDDIGGGDIAKLDAADSILLSLETKLNEFNQALDDNPHKTANESFKAVSQRLIRGILTDIGFVFTEDDDAINPIKTMRATVAVARKIALINHDVQETGGQNFTDDEAKMIVDQLIDDPASLNYIEQQLANKGGEGEEFGITTTPEDKAKIDNYVDEKLAEMFGEEFAALSVEEQEIAILEYSEEDQEKYAQYMRIKNMFVIPQGDAGGGDGEEGDGTGDGEEGDGTGDGEEGDGTGDGEEGDGTGDGEEGDGTGDGEEGDGTGDGV
ncbi:MAG: CvpA family protein [Christensenellaceae bacterium]|jgi:hypothetical protein|nr:CvpA family protein [Christensenellaceae bacterium]